jgi:hypothetical protein
MGPCRSDIVGNASLTSKWIHAGKSTVNASAYLQTLSSNYYTCAALLSPSGTSLLQRDALRAHKGATLRAPQLQRLGQSVVGPVRAKGREQSVLHLSRGR